MALTVSFVSPPMQILVDLHVEQKAKCSIFHCKWYAPVPCNAFLGDIITIPAICDLRTYNSCIPSQRSDIVHKRSFKREEADLVMSTLLDIILESKYDKAALVCCLPRMASRRMRPPALNIPWRLPRM